MSNYNLVWNLSFLCEMHMNEFYVNSTQTLFPWLKWKICEHNILIYRYTRWYTYLSVQGPYTRTNWDIGFRLIRYHHGCWSGLHHVGLHGMAFLHCWTVNNGIAFFWLLPLQWRMMGHVEPRWRIVKIEHVICVINIFEALIQFN